MTTARDPAIDALLVAETLIAQFDRVIAGLASTFDKTELLIGEGQQVYPAIWAHLDEAHRELVKRGADVSRYDAIRARQPKALLGVEDIRIMAQTEQIALAAAVGVVLAGILAKSASGNKPGRNDAVMALAVLRNAMPAVDWVRERAEGDRAAASLAGASVRRRWTRLAIAVGVAVVLAGGAVFAIKAMKSGTAPAPDADMRAVRRGQVDGLRARLAKNPCEAVSAELLVKQLVAVGEREAAERDGRAFVERCGENAFIRAQLAAIGAELPALPDAANGTDAAP
jgi:hypothetical protein